MMSLVSGCSLTVDSCVNDTQLSGETDRDKGVNGISVPGSLAMAFYATKGSKTTHVTSLGVYVCSIVIESNTVSLVWTKNQARSNPSL